MFSVETQRTALLSPRHQNMKGWHLSFPSLQRQACPNPGMQERQRLWPRHTCTGGAFEVREGQEQRGEQRVAGPGAAWHRGFPLARLRGGKAPWVLPPHYRVVVGAAGARPALTRVCWGRGVALHPSPSLPCLVCPLARGAQRGCIATVMEKGTGSAGSPEGRWLRLAQPSEVFYKYKYLIQ